MIYLQSNAEGMPFCFEVCCALYGCIDNGYNYKFVQYDDIVDGKYDNEILTNVFVGSVEFMKAVFHKIGKESVRLPCNSNRLSEIMTLSEAIEKVSPTNSLFIKPVDIKLFTGFVHNGGQYGCLDGLDNDVSVYVYPPFAHDIISEWRLYVYNGGVTDSCCYDGGFRHVPDYDLIDSIVAFNTESFPDTYTIDVAVLSDGSTVVVEYNDMWAIGNYGVPNWVYIDMLIRRYKQIVGYQL